MVFVNRPAGTTTRANPKLEHRAQAAENTAKGKVVVHDDTGFIVTVDTTGSGDGRTKFVTVEAKDNSVGSPGDTSIAVVGPGQFVTVETTTTLVAGDRVKASTTVAGDVERFVPTTDTADELVGTFLRKEGGQIRKNVSTPFTEEFLDDGDFAPGSAAINDIVEIRID